MPDTRNGSKVVGELMERMSDYSLSELHKLICVKSLKSAQRVIGVT